MNKKLRLFLPVSFTVFIVFLFYLKRIILLKYYPVCVNFIFFIIFFSSLFTKETIIQKIAKTMDGKLTDKTAVYTRKLTYIWCIFTFFNFIISLITVFLPDKYWILYNGLISYLLMGTLFITEYLIRINIRKKGLL